ncbi:MAG TPA: sigma-70 family RNA polymerase sigma factor [Vicinamibacterales bacterium]|jgi:RNA polymerase sigma factor (sigma-70 family)
MDVRKLLEDNIELVERIVRRACKRVGVPPSDVEDVVSTVKLALVENDYAILRRFEGRSSLATYLTIIVQRRLADERERTHGRWRPSAEAQRLGPRAVLIEDIVGRQRRSFQEAMPIVRAVDTSITSEEIADIAGRLPQRAPRPREVELSPEMPVASAEGADRTAVDGELRDLSRRATILIRQTMAEWPPDDRLLVRLRFESSLTIADISRLMNQPQRPLYRRLEWLLRHLRGVLQNGGIDGATADDLLDATQRTNVEFESLWKNGEMHRTHSLGARGYSEEGSV